MTDARQRSYWHRTGLVVSASAMLLVVATTDGCSSDPNTTSTTAATTSSSAVSSSSGSGGAGGGGETGGAGGGSATFEAQAACNGETFNTPFDATPDPEGLNIYFTALDPTGKAGVFKGPSKGGGPCAPIHVGDPFVAPFNLAISTDSAKVYVADQGSEEANDAGLIFTLATVGGSAPEVLTGTEGMKPRGLDTLNSQTGDILYFTGKDKATGAVGVFTFGDGKLNPVATGAPFVDPSGIAVTAQGISYVCDTIGTPAGKANIIMVDQQGMAKVYVSGLRVSYPCGVALTPNDQTLLVSGLDPLTETDAIIKISLELNTVEYLTKDINIFTEAAGMHRAKSAKNFAWVDSKANNTGTVFNVTVE